MARLLMHKNEVVARLECNNFYIKNIEVVNDFLMPFRVTDNEKTNNAYFLDWKRSRPRPCMPQNFSNPLLAHIGNTYEDISNYINASLIDCYWFKPEELNISWEDINYFDHKMINQKENEINLSDKMYKYTDSSVFLEEALNSHQGYKRFIKYFTLDKNENYCIVKACDILNCGMDVFNEIIGNILEDVLDIEGAQYYIFPYNFEYKNIKYNIPLIACELCIQDDSEEMILASSLLKNEELSDYNLYEYVTGLGFKEEINKMIVLDYLLLNPDRGLDNIGFIRDSETLAYKRLAPIYDCGAAFNYYGANDTLKREFDDYSQPFLKRHSRQIELVDDFSFVDFDALYEVVDVIDAVISYSALSKEVKNNMINTLKIRISELEEIVTGNKSKNNAVQMVRAADKINKRFNVDMIIKMTGIDPVTAQDPKYLFINYLSDAGKKEFEEFDKDNPNFKDRFDKFKKDTLCIQ